MVQSSIPSPQPTNGPRQFQARTTLCLYRRAKAHHSSSPFPSSDRSPSPSVPGGVHWGNQGLQGTDCSPTPATLGCADPLAGPWLLSLPISRSHLFCCVYTQKTRGCPLFSSSHDTSNYPASKYPIWLLVFSFFFFSF